MVNPPTQQYRPPMLITNKSLCGVSLVFTFSVLLLQILILVKNAVSLGCESGCECIAGCHLCLSR